MYLCDRADKEAKCFLSIRTIAKDLSIGTSTVKRALNDLEKLGHIARVNRKRTNGGKSSNMYYLTPRGKSNF